MSARTITLTLPYPISANRYWASRVVTPGGENVDTPELREALATYGDAVKRGKPEDIANASTILFGHINKRNKSMSMTYVTPEAKAFKAQVLALARAARIDEPILGRVRIDIQLYPRRPLDWQKRMRAAGAAWDETVQCIDLDNARKVLYDSLKGVAMEDDKWVFEETGKRMEPDGEARVVVTITALAIEQPQMGLPLPPVVQPAVEAPLPF